MTFLLRILEKFFSSYPLPIETGSIHKVLVVDLNFLGDMVLSSPVHRALKERLVSARVDALAYPFAQQALSANPYINQIHIIRQVNLLAQLRTLLALRRLHYDLVLQLNTSLRTNILMWIIGARYRLGYDYAHRGFLNTMRVPISTRTAKTRYRVDECVDLLEKAFGWKITNRQMVFEVGQEESSIVRERLAGHGISDNDLLIGIHPNCRQGWDLRRWDQKKFSELSNLLIEKHGASLVFSGSNDDEEYIGGILGSIGKKQKVLNFAGKLSLRELAALFQRLDVFVTINTGPMHIAIAHGTPTVALIGGTPPPVIYPINDERFQYVMDPGLRTWDPLEMISTHVPAMKSIEVSEVLERVERLLKLTTRQAGNRR